MAEFIYLYRNDPASRKEHMGTPEAAQKSMQRWMAWMRDLEGKGHLKSAGQPLDRSGKLVRGGSKAVTDGPFVEAKEFMGGFYLLDVEDEARAIELATQIPDARIPGLALEVRPVVFADLGDG